MRTRARCLILMIAMLVASNLSYAGDPPVIFANDYTTVPVIIDILKDAGVTKEDAREAVREANKILKASQSKLRLKIQGEIKTGVTDIDGDGKDEDKDGKLTRSERDEIRAAGAKELKNTLKNEKGIKIVFAKEPDSSDKDTTGIAVHKDYTIIVKGSGKTAKQQAGTMVHEMLHSLTLVGKYQYQYSDPKDSDPDGHTPDTKNNIMYPTEDGGTKITPLQIQKIRKDKQLEKVSKSVTQDTPTSPGVKREQQFGTAPDSLADNTGTSASHFDLLQTTLSSEYSRETINGLLSLGGLFPDTGPVDASYSLLWDIDASSSTGVSRGGFPGMEREVQLHVTGDYSLGPLAVSGSVIDLLSGFSTSLPDPVILAEAKEILDYSGVPAEPHEPQFTFDTPKSLLGLTATEVPVAVIAEDQFSIYDTASFLFDQERWLKDPSLITVQGVVQPGDAFFYQITGLMPDSAFDFFLDDTMLFSGVLDSFGGASGSFIFPSVPVDYYFLTAQDSTGEFAFNKVHSTPEPSAVVLLVLGLTSAVARLRLNYEEGV